MKNRARIAALLLSSVMCFSNLPYGYANLQKVSAATAVDQSSEIKDGDWEVAGEVTLDNPVTITGDTTITLASDSKLIIPGSLTATDAKVTVKGSGILEVPEINGNVYVEGGIIETNSEIPEDHITGNCMVWTGYNGEVYGAFKLQRNYTIPEEGILHVGKDQYLTVTNGRTLTNNGEMYIEGTLQNEDGSLPTHTGSGHRYWPIKKEYDGGSPLLNLPEWNDDTVSQPIKVETNKDILKQYASLKEWQIWDDSTSSWIPLTNQKTDDFTKIKLKAIWNDSGLNDLWYLHTTVENGPAEIMDHTTATSAEVSTFTFSTRYPIKLTQVRPVDLNEEQTLYSYAIYGSNNSNGPWNLLGSNDGTTTLSTDCVGTTAYKYYKFESLGDEVKIYDMFIKAKVYDIHYLGANIASQIPVQQKFFIPGVGFALPDPKSFTGPTGGFIQGWYTKQSCAANDPMISSIPEDTDSDITVYSKEVKKLEAVLSTTQVNDKVYDGTTTATTSGEYSLSGITAGDDVKLDASDVTASFKNKNAESGKLVTLAGGSLSGEDAYKYKIVSDPNLKANITAKELIQSDVSVSNKEYDGTDAAGKITLGSLLGAVKGDTVKVDMTNAKATFESKTVGKNKDVFITGLALSGNAAANYTLNAPSKVKADITPKTVQVDGLTPEDKDYDGTVSVVATGTAKLIGGITGEDVSLVPGTLEWEDKKVGAEKAVKLVGWSLSGTDAENYVLNTTLVATGEITPRYTSFEDIKIVDKVYDGDITAELKSAPVLKDIVEGDDVKPVVGEATFEDSDVGVDKVVTFGDFGLGGEDAANYKLLRQPKDSKGNITKKEMKVTALDKRIVSGQNAPSLSSPVLDVDYTLEGLIPNEKLSSVSMQYEKDDIKTNPITSEVGSYSIVPTAVKLSRGNVNNYDIKFRSATLTIDNPRTLVITAEPNDELYGLVTGGGNIQEGQQCTLVAQPASFCEFQNWTMNGEIVGTSPTYKFIPTDDTTIRANFKLKSFVVTFNGDGGTETAPQQVEYGDYVVKPNEPLREGYKFVDWVNESTKKAWDFAKDKVTKAMTLVASWQEQKVVYVTFDSNGGTGNMTTVNVEAGQEFTFPKCAFNAPEGYEFSHWTVGKSKYAVGDKLVLQNDLEVTAEYSKLATVTLKFDSNGGKGSMDNATVTVDGNYALPSCGFEAPTGMQFLCWEVNNRDKNPGDVITVTRDMTITAQWESQPVVVVSFESNGGTGSVDSQRLQAGTEFTVPECKFTAPDGAVFRSWMIGNRDVAPGEKITLTKSITLEADWTKPESTTISFEANGGKGKMDSAVIATDSKYTLPQCGFTAPAGSRFLCWEVNGKDKNPGDIIIASSNTTIIAQWEKIVVASVVFDANGGTGSMTTMSVNSGTDIALPNNTFTAPTGYQFGGWEIGTKTYKAGDKVVITKDTTVTAVWNKLNLAIVTFDANGGSGTMTKLTLNLNTEYALPTCAFTAPSGQQFSTWEVNGKDYKPGEKVNLTKDVTIKAIWEKQTSFTVTFDANGGSGTMGKVTVNTTGYTLPTCAFTPPTGKQFSKWEVNGKEYKQGDSVTLSKDVTIKAIWEAATSSSASSAGGGGGAAGGAAGSTTTTIANSTGMSASASSDSSSTTATSESLEGLEREVSEEVEEYDTGSTTVDVGDILISGEKESKASYSITNEKAVEYLATSSTKKKVTIPATVTIDGNTYKVTKISKEAFSGNIDLKSLVIGKNIKKIGAKAFDGCISLTEITVQSKKMTVAKVKNCLKGSSVNTIYVPKSTVSTYKKVFTKKATGAKDKVTVKAIKK